MHFNEEKALCLVQQCENSFIFSQQYHLNCNLAQYNMFIRQNLNRKNEIVSLFTILYSILTHEYLSLIDC